MLQLFENHVPLKSVTKKIDVELWIDQNVINAMAERDISYGVWRHTKTDDDKMRYRRSRNRVKKLIRNGEREYNKRFLDPTLPSKILWRNLGKVGVKETSQTSVIFSPDQLNNFFTIPRPQIVVTNPVYGPWREQEFYFCNTSELEVYNSVNQIKSNAIGLDGVPLRFLKLILLDILPVLTFIFNSILTKSFFPKHWKISKVVPIAKVKDPAHLADYRPISILPALSKALELIMRRQIVDYVDRKGLLTRWQSGFRAGRSTQTALLKVTDYLFRASDRKLLSILALLDFSKAFDCVDHDLLCLKLGQQFGFSTSAVSLIKSYLTNRMQSVWVNGSYSSQIPVSSGVVQGSVLGPLLFSLFINDIEQSIKSCNFHLYADDVQLYYSGPRNCLAEIVAEINKDLERVFQWSTANGLMLNSRKSQVMIIGTPSNSNSLLPIVRMNGEPIDFVEKVKNLGLWMNGALSWRDHVSKICSGVTFTLRRLWATAHSTPIGTRMKLVKALNLPKFLNCDLIFSNTLQGLRDRLRVCFNDCARYIFCRSRSQSISQYTNRILGLELEKYYNLRKCCFMHQLIHLRKPDYLYDFSSAGRRVCLYFEYHDTIYSRFNSRFLSRLLYCGITYQQLSERSTMSRSSSMRAGSTCKMLQFLGPLLRGVQLPGEVGEG